MAISAVIFDVGGVVRESALPILREFERSHAVPAEFISLVVGKALTRANGPQQRLEKGEILLDEFCRVFDEEFAAQGHRLSTAEIMLEMSRNMRVRPLALAAVDKLRAGGFKVAALTNTWKTGESESEEQAALEACFDLYVESYEEGLRKPDPALLKGVCERLEVAPDEVAYLDELGKNLKPAAKLGMRTIKVKDLESALEELAALTNVSFEHLDGEPHKDEHSERENE